ncbi:MAG: HAD hydrolase-like protein [Clostridia bacterium]|nr:HAD hydrolase-like protein [Clostridia bacterium]
MAIKAVLFDLDGTLLPMDQNQFLKGYFGLLTEKMVKSGYDAKTFMKALLTGTDAMVANDGATTNEALFWREFGKFYTPETLPPITLFDEFYEKDFPKTRAFCGYDARPRKIVDAVKEKGLLSVLATAPAFPAIATETRMGYVGLSPDDFLFYTTYENCTYCKPSEGYYREVVKKIGCDPSECLMVGNDVTDDMVPASAVGMQVFLLTDYLINKNGADIGVYKNGGYDELLAYIASL